MLWNRQRRSGLSLIEVIIVSTVLLLLVGILTVTFVRGTKVWKKVENETTLLRELQTAIRNLERDLSTGQPYGLTQSDMAVATLSCRDNDDRPIVNDRGEPIWSKFVLQYVDNAGLMRIRTVDIGAPTSEGKAFEEETGTTLGDYLNNFPEPQDRRLTHSGRITKFELTPVGNYGSLYELELEAEETVNTDQVDTLSLKTTVSVRNR